MTSFVKGALVALSVAGGLSMAALSTPAFAEGFDVNVTSTDLALRGVDPVSYFTESKPVQGDVEINAEHNGAVYRFASEANKALFTADPEKYAPQFGGYCAFGLAKGFKFDGDPNVWKIVDDKLYVNLSPKVGELWKADTATLIKDAETQWTTIKDVDPASLNP